MDDTTLVWPTGFPGGNREYTIRLTGDITGFEADRDDLRLTVFFATPSGRRLMCPYPFGSFGAYSKAVAELSSHLRGRIA